MTHGFSFKQRSKALITGYIEAAKFSFQLTIQTFVLFVELHLKYKCAQDRTTGKINVVFSIKQVHPLGMQISLHYELYCSTFWPTGGTTGKVRRSLNDYQSSSGDPADSQQFSQTSWSGQAFNV